MLVFALSLLAAATIPNVGPTPTPQINPTPGPGIQVIGEPGAPKLVKSELLDGDFDRIDAGVHVQFTKTGRRYEVWEVHKSVSMNHVKVLAFDAAGTELWRSKLTWTAQQAWWKMLGGGVDGQGNLYIVYATMNEVHQWRIAKVTTGGEIAWTKTLHSAMFAPEPAFVEAHPDGGVVVHTVSDGKDRDMYTARVAGDGTILWQDELDVAGVNQYPGGVAVASDGSIYAVGHDSMGAAFGKSGVRVRKYAADGSVKWTRSFEMNTAYEHPVARHVFLDAQGHLVVAGSTYAGGNEDDWVFALKYRPDGTRARTLIHSVGKDKVSDGGLKGVYATHGPDDAIYLAYDKTDGLAPDWAIMKMRVPGEDAQIQRTRTPSAVSMQPLPPGIAGETPSVVWTKTFTGDAAMSVAQLAWFPQGAIGVLGQGRRKLEGYAYRSSTRLRVLKADGTDLGATGFESTGDFNNDPHAIAVDASGTAFVLGWQYWSGDGWNDENVMRLQITARK